MLSICLQRVYDARPPFSPHTYLVDRLWPRGISKERLTGVIWIKNVAPSNALRQWFHQHLNEWDFFCQQYRTELENNDTLSLLIEPLQAGNVITLLYGSREIERNHAQVLRDYLLSH